MVRVYELIEVDSQRPVRFSSKASSSDGVFRSFAKRYFSLLKEGTIYRLYANVDSGFEKIASAYWNGKTFVKVLYRK